MAPQLLIGHSFGGAAILAAAGSLDSVKAVAVIGAPFDVEHILHQVSGALDGPNVGNRVPVSIAGRDFSLSPEFVEDLRTQDQQGLIGQLGRALLVLHSPTDDVVSIDNAAKIFAAARHPKSFVSLDGADHLLRGKADADYAAAVIAAWASRYLDEAAHEPALPIQGVRVEETGGGKFQVRVTTAAGSFLADEPTTVGGLGSVLPPMTCLARGWARARR